MKLFLDPDLGSVLHFLHLCLTLGERKLILELYLRKLQPPYTATLYSNSERVANSSELLLHLTSIVCFFQTQGLEEAYQLVLDRTVCNRSYTSHHAHFSLAFSTEDRSRPPMDDKQVQSQINPYPLQPLPPFFTSGVVRRLYLCKQYGIQPIRAC